MAIMMGTNVDQNVKLFFIVMIVVVFALISV